jgi:hypothetical protein
MNVTYGPSLVVKVRITGTDANGSTVFEDLTFKYPGITPARSDYEVPAIGDCQENPKNFQVTDTVFTSVTNLMVLQRVSDGPAAILMVYADLDPMQAEALRDVCPLVEAFWDGQGICRVRDIRPISSRLEVPSRTNPIKALTQALLSTFVSQGKDATELLGEDLRDPYRFRLSDPLRFFKFADGLRSSVSPEQPGVESLGIRTDQDIYISQALRLVDGSTRFVHVALVGIDAQTYWLNGQDGTVPSVEYRTAPKIDPDAWTVWTEVNPLAYGNGCNFQIVLPDDTSFKFQLRIKGKVAGIAAIQYADPGGASVTTTGNSWTDIYSVFLSENRAVSIDATVQGFRNNGQEAAVFKVLSGARRATGGNVTVVDAGTTPIHTIRDNALWDIQAVVDTGNQLLKLQVKGQVGSTIYWKIANIRQTWNAFI